MGRTDLSFTESDLVVEIAKAEHKEVSDSFNGEQTPFDLAVVFVESPIQFGDNVRPICIPEEPEEGKDAYENDMVWIAGMNATQSVQKSRLELFTDTPFSCRIQCFSQRWFASNPSNHVPVRVRTI